MPDCGRAYTAFVSGLAKESEGIIQRTSIKAYRDTSVNWMTTQGQITKLLNAHQIYDIQFTTISQVTAEQSGLHMDKDTVAIMLVFQKHVKLDDGRSGTIPVRIIIPNV